MPKAARKGDLGRHDRDDLTAVQGSPNVFINGQPAVRVGDMYQSDAHPATTGSATVNINGRPAVRIGDLLGGHATASTGSPNVFIGDSSYGAAQSKTRPVYEILLTQVPGSADPAHVYNNYPYKLYHNGRLVQQGRSDERGIIAYEYDPPLKGELKVEMASGDTLTLPLASFAPASTHRGITQRLQAMGYFHNEQESSDPAFAVREMNSDQGDHAVHGQLEKLVNAVKAKMP